MPVEVNRSSHPSQSRVSRNSLCRYRSCSTSSFRSLAGAKLDAVAILEALKTACLADTFRTFLHVFGPGSEHFTHRHFAETVHRSSNIVRNAALTGIAVKTDPFACSPFNPSWQRQKLIRSSALTKVEGELIRL